MLVRRPHRALHHAKLTFTDQFAALISLVSSPPLLPPFFLSFANATHAQLKVFLIDPWCCHSLTTVSPPSLTAFHKTIDHSSHFLSVCLKLESAAQPGEGVLILGVIHQPLAEEVFDGELAPQCVFKEGFLCPIMPTFSSLPPLCHSSPPLEQSLNRPSLTCGYSLSPVRPRHPSAVCPA